MTEQYFVFSRIYHHFLVSNSEGYCSTDKLKFIIIGPSSRAPPPQSTGTVIILTQIPLSEHADIILECPPDYDKYQGKMTASCVVISIDYYD